MVNIPSFVVRLDSQKHIDFSLRSPYGGGRPGNFYYKFKIIRKQQIWMLSECVIVEVFVSFNLETDTIWIQ